MMKRSAFVFVVFALCNSTAFALVGAVEESKVNTIAENVRLINGTIMYEQSDPQYKEWREQRRRVNMSFTTMTLKMIEEENARKANVQNVIWWTNTAGIVAAVTAHVFLLFGFVFGIAEMVRAYQLRKKGKKEENIDVELGLEGAAIKTRMYGVLIFGASIVVYFGFLQYVYPIITVG